MFTHYRSFTFLHGTKLRLTRRTCPRAVAACAAGKTPPFRPSLRSCCRVKELSLEASRFSIVHFASMLRSLLARVHSVPLAREKLPPDGAPSGIPTYLRYSPLPPYLVVR